MDHQSAFPGQSSFNMLSALPLQQQWPEPTAHQPQPKASCGKILLLICVLLCGSVFFLPMDLVRTFAGLVFPFSSWDRAHRTCEQPGLEGNAFAGLVSPHEQPGWKVRVRVSVGNLPMREG